jgi:hypothetical protein
MKKLLIISPHFSPVNAPDMQRVRMALPYLRGLGWEPTVLAIAPESIEGAVIERKLEETYPSDIRVIRVKGISARYTRWAGFGNLWLRCGRAYRKEGERLLKSERFDLSLISTTQFAAFKLGPLWRKKFGLPYVLDYQDPWINDYYNVTGTAPPGGRIKFALSQWEASILEPAALRESSGVIAVSNSYGTMLSNLYPWFLASRAKLLPFGGASSDFERLGDYRPAKPIIDFTDGLNHQVYVGRCGPDMSIALRILFKAFGRYHKTHPEKASRMRFHFIGTDYSPPPMGRDWAVPVAREAGLGDFVQEHRYRVAYFDSLYYLRNAQALIAVGSNDPNYSASKFFSYVLARRPFLMVFHSNSPVIRFAQNVSAGLTFGFKGNEDIDSVADLVYQQWFVEEQHKVYRAFSDEAFAPYTAEHMVKGLVAVFDDALRDAASNRLAAD